MLAVTNPDTVKRIRSTLRRVALRPTRDVVNACFALAVIGERERRQYTQNAKKKKNRLAAALFTV